MSIIKILDCLRPQRFGIGTGDALEKIIEIGRIFKPERVGDVG